MNFIPESIRTGYSDHNLYDKRSVQILCGFFILHKNYIKFIQNAKKHLKFLKFMIQYYM